MTVPALYETTVVHARRQPRVRSFRHRYYLWLVDIDALPRLPRLLAPFARFRAADHGDGGAAGRGATIRDDLDAWLAEQGVDLRGGRVLMLASARVAGHVFNPLSVFWCYRDDGGLACVVAEVHNTYGGRHRYLLHPDANGDDTAEKRFYVSPFITVAGTYRLHVPEPDRRLDVTVALDQADGRVLTAVLRGRRLPATRWQLIRLLFRRAVRSLPVRVLLPDGSQLGEGGPDAPVMRLVRPTDFFHRLGVDAKIGFGESYMAGDCTSDELAELLTPFAARLATLVPPTLQRLRRWVDRRRPEAERNDLAGAKSNIGRHYDLCNELFASFLDETMTYSAAWFEHPGQSLYEAQLRKIDGVLDYAGVREGNEVLEIGTGWGALAIRAAQRGAHVTSLTISAEQRELAERRIAAAGVSDRATVLLRDYREATGSYDAIVSVEMLEAVGLEYWPTFFRSVDRLLRPGGRIGLQVITMPHDRMLATSESYTWIHKYVFPGGMLPSVRAIEEAVAGNIGLRITERRTLGFDYAETLRLWRERFLASWEEIHGAGFDETFRRMWEFYLAYSEAGFRSSYLDDWQFSMVKPAS